MYKAKVRLKSTNKIRLIWSTIILIYGYHMIKLCFSIIKKLATVFSYSKEGGLYKGNFKVFAVAG